MATGRTHLKYVRVYMNGYDMSGFDRAIGPLSVDYDAPTSACLSDSVKGALCGHPTINAGVFNGVFDPVAFGLHALFKTNATSIDLMVAVGIRAVPAPGDQVFGGVFAQKDYMVTPPMSGEVTASITLPSYYAPSVPAYANPWGVLLHELKAETAIDQTFVIIDNGAATTAGGIMRCQVTASAGGTDFAVIVEDSANGSTFAALSGATTGTTHDAIFSSVVALSTTATVRRYLRWGITLGTATSVTFALSFTRG